MDQCLKYKILPISFDKNKQKIVEKSLKKA